MTPIILNNNELRSFVNAAKDGVAVIDAVKKLDDWCGKQWPPSAPPPALLYKVQFHSCRLYLSLRRQNQNIPYQ